LQSPQKEEGGILKDLSYSISALDMSRGTAAELALKVLGIFMSRCVIKKLRVVKANNKRI